jgi:hypothetical protein
MLAVFAFAALAVFLPALVRMGLLGAFLVLYTRPEPLANGVVRRDASPP